MLLTKWKNDRSPRTVAATVAGKREHVSRQAYCRTCAVQPSEMVTSFYVTFRLESGDELELQVPEQEFGDLAEGIRGVLSFRGSRYLGFERE